MSIDPYRHPYLYDLEYETLDEDLDYYVNLARSVGRTVLELGCGNGRISLPIVKAGVALHGIDCSTAMLDDLRKKRACQRPEVQRMLSYSLGDFETLGPDSAWPPNVKQALYSLILLPFNAIHHCKTPESVQAMLAGVTSLLAPGGTFALDGYFPDPELQKRDPNEKHEPMEFKHPKTGETITSWEQGWWETETQIYNVVYTYAHPDGSEQNTHLRLRMYEQAELFALFEQAGFQVVWTASDFEGTPLKPGALKWVARLQRK